MQANMVEEDSRWCSSCACSRPSGEFNRFKSGVAKKTCFRHEKTKNEKTKKRSLQFDQWDDFMSELNAWNDSVCYPWFPLPNFSFFRLTSIIVASRSRYKAYLQPGSITGIFWF